MKRYSLIMDPETAEYDLIPTAAYGDWVRFDDHAAEVHALNNKLTAAWLELAAIKALLESDRRASAALRRRTGPLHARGCPCDTCIGGGPTWSNTPQMPLKGD